VSEDARDEGAARRDRALRQRARLVERLRWTLEALERRARRYSELALDVADLLPDLSARGAAHPAIDARAVALAVTTLGLGLSLFLLRGRHERDCAGRSLERALGRFVRPDVALMLAWRVVCAAGPRVLVLARDATRRAAQRRSLGGLGGARVIASPCGEMARASRDEAPV
jgi:hypothetical protein